MANVRNLVTELKTQQENLQASIEELSVQIKQMEAQNYELEQTILSLKHKEDLTKQKIAVIAKQETEKLKQIQKLQASIPGADESSDSLTAKSQDAHEKHDKLLDELKETQEQANRNEMMYDEVKKRLVHIEQNMARFNKRADMKEAEAKRLEDGFQDVNSQVENFKSKDIEDSGDLSEQVTELQKKLDESIRSFETAERQGAACDRSIANTKDLLKKQKAENDKIRKEMEAMNASLEAFA